MTSNNAGSDNIGLIKKNEIVDVKQEWGKINRVDHIDLKGLPALEIESCGSIGSARIVSGIVPEDYIGKPVFVDIIPYPNASNRCDTGKILRVYERMSGEEKPGRVIAQNTTLDYKVNQ